MPDSQQRDSKQADNQEKVLYKGTPSQWVNFRAYLLCAVLLIITIVAVPLWKNVFEHSLAAYKPLYFAIVKLLPVLAILWAGKAWVLIATHKYSITTERFSETEGVFSRTTEVTELFRVRDISFDEPFFLRIVGCGNIILNTNDTTSPIIVLHGLKNAHNVMEILRKNVDIMRTRKGVREVEI